MKLTMRILQVVPLILRWPACCQFCISHFKRRTGASLLGLVRVAESALSDHGALMCHIGRSNFGLGCHTGASKCKGGTPLIQGAPSIAS